MSVPKVEKKSKCKDGHCVEKSCKNGRSGINYIF